MSRIRMLNGIARNIAHKFSVSASHFAYLSHMNKVTEIKIDLLSLSIEPELFSIDRNLNLVVMCKKNLLDIIDRLNIPTVNIVKAQLIARFNISELIRRENGTDSVAAYFEATLHEARGRKFMGAVKTTVIIHG